MDRRKSENLRVKQRITNTLFSLMAEQSLSDIHLTQLVEGAGVARASFYRNYNSKEDVLITVVRDILEEYRREVLLSFQYFRKYRSYFLDLCRSSFSALLLES